jgi:hypothetical protein
MRAFEQEKQMTSKSYAERHGMEVGRARGQAEGRAEGIRMGIRVLLEARFGGDGLTLLDLLPADLDADRLAAILQHLGTAGTLEDARRVVAPPASAT